MPAQQVRQVCGDLSPACAKGIREQFPQARLVFDFFHVVQLLTPAVDAVRRRERARFPELLTGTRYLWLKKEENLSAAQQDQRRQLCRNHLQTAKAYAHAVAEAVSGLRGWYNWVCHARIPEMIKVAKSIQAHWAGIVAYRETRLTNAGAEAMNGIIQTAKRKARGFRSFECFQTIIYLIGSQLKFALPIPVPSHPHQTS